MDPIHNGRVIGEMTFAIKILEKFSNRLVLIHKMLVILAADINTGVAII